MRKAVIIGINQYPGNALNGCINDAWDYKDLLILNGYESANIRLILDSDACTPGIKYGMDWLSSSWPSDLTNEAYLCYSGHGSQVPDQTHPSGLDDCICPVNIDDVDYWSNGIISGSYIAQWLNSFQKGVRIFLVFDCCHSGTADRELNPHKEKFLHQPKFVKDKIALISSKPHRRRRVGHRAFREIVPKGRGLWYSITNLFRRKHKQTLPSLPPVQNDPSATIDPSFNHCLISGCRDDQTSADAVIDGRPNGALTYYLVRDVKANPMGTVQYIHTIARQEILSAGYTQDSQIDGPPELLNGKFFA